MSPDHQAVEAAPFVHPTAIVEQGARLGPGTRVWHHGHVRSGATVGAGCVLGKNVFIDQGVTIGDRSKIQNNVSVYAGVHIGDEVFVGPSAVFTNDLYPRAGNTDWQVVETAVHEGASIGANATIICGTDIGAWSMIAAGSVVTRDVEPYALVAGNPARRIGWVCRCGRVVDRASPQRPDGPCPHCGRIAGDPA